MSIDTETAAFYDRAASDYADRFHLGRPDADMLAFMAALPAGGRVLDFGCGPGRAAALLAEAGFAVEATDISAGMIAIARERFGIEARQAAFDTLDAIARYDGIWANFSLLHAPRAEMPDHLARMHRALRPGGILHLALKLGSGERRDRLGRFYSYHSEDELRRLLAAAGFVVTGARRFFETGMAGTNDPAISLLAHA